MVVNFLTGYPAIQVPEMWDPVKDQIRDDYQSLLLLAKRYPDLYLDVELIEEQLDSAKDYYNRAKDKKRTLTGDANERLNSNH